MSLQRRTPMKRGAPLKRSGRLKPRSDKRKNEAEQRALVLDVVRHRQGGLCAFVESVPEIRCAYYHDRPGLEGDERKSRARYPGGHLDPANVQMICPAHHDWKTSHDAEAQARGLSEASWA